MRLLRLALLLALLLPSAFPAAAQPPAPRPVVLLPGMGASANWPCLLQELNCAADAAWSWMPTAGPHYAPLIARLEAAGYTPANGLLTVFFYDWRKPLEANLARLQARLAAVKTQTGAPQVDLIGHSMGGLLARAYVQSSSYAGDVAHLVTLGSPHRGAAKAYPYWEAADFYGASAYEKIAYGAVLTYYRLRLAQPFSVYALRAAIPAFADILPVSDYLYADPGGDVRLESGLRHRNAALARLNLGLETLYARAGVAVFYGSGLPTPGRFYVRPRAFWQWPNWDDGFPVWSRGGEFLAGGDGTVTAESAVLPAPAYAREFPGVAHAALTADPAVIEALCAYLGLPAAAAVPTPPAPQAAVVLYLDGPAEAVLADPQNRLLAAPEFLTPGSDLKSSLLSAGATLPGDSDSPSPYSPIPSSQYVALSPDPFNLLVVPVPAAPGDDAGPYRLQVVGAGSGEFTLGLLAPSDPAGSPPAAASPIPSLGDSFRAAIEPGLAASFIITATASITDTPPLLLAETPLIELPLWASAAAVTGRALPGARVEVYAADSAGAATGAPLAAGTAGPDGRFSLPLLAPLLPGQRLVPTVDGHPGLGAAARPRQVFLPLAVLAP